MRKTKENEYLKSENERLKIVNETLKNENEKLKQEVKVKTTIEYVPIDPLNYLNDIGPIKNNKYNPIIEASLDFIFEYSISYNKRKIFNVDNENPLTKLPAFNEWFETLDREDFHLLSSKYRNIRLYEFLENCTISEIKDIFKETAKRYYSQQYELYIKECEQIIKEHLKEQLKGEEKKGV